MFDQTRNIPLLFASGKQAMPLLWLVALRCDYERDGPSKKKQKMGHSFLNMVSG